MGWKFTSDKPIFMQVMDIIKFKIISGEYAPGEKMPGVRELGTEAGVNPNTLQRALQELEREGLVYSQRTVGRFITDNRELINKNKENTADEIAKEYYDRMSELGYTGEEIIYNAAKKVREME